MWQWRGVTSYLKKNTNLIKTVEILLARKWLCVSPRSGAAAVGLSSGEKWVLVWGGGSRDPPASPCSQSSLSLRCLPSISGLCLRWGAFVTHSYSVSLNPYSSHFLSFSPHSSALPSQVCSSLIGFPILVIRDHFWWSKCSKGTVSNELQRSEEKWTRYLRESGSYTFLM